MASPRSRSALGTLLAAVVVMAVVLLALGLIVVGAVVLALLGLLPASRAWAQERWAAVARSSRVPRPARALALRAGRSPRAAGAVAGVFVAIMILGQVGAARPGPAVAALPVPLPAASPAAVVTSPAVASAAPTSPSAVPDDDAGRAAVLLAATGDPGQAPLFRAQLRTLHGACGVHGDYPGLVAAVRSQATSQRDVADVLREGTAVGGAAAWCFGAFPETSPATAAPSRASLPTTSPAPAQSVPGLASCAPGYPDVCLPVDEGDLDCGDLADTDFRSTGTDEFRLDGDGDGIACESSSGGPLVAPGATAGTDSSDGTGDSGLEGPDDGSGDEPVYYENCAAARAAGAAPLYDGDPGYRSGLDRDSDGIACE